MDKKQYRCYKLEYEKTSVPSIEELDKMVSPWMKRKGDPCCVIEVFKDRDRIYMEILLWTRCGVSIRLLKKLIPCELENITAIDHVNMGEQLSFALCENKDNRVLALRRGF